MILDTELDPCVALGFSGGPEWSSRITTLANGHERRNARWANPRHRWTAPFQGLTPAQYKEIKRVFMACRGMTYGFLFRDKFDYQATGEALGTTPSGTTPVQLVASYTSDGNTYNRTITRPVADGFTLYQTNGSGTPTAKAGTLDTETGLFTPTTAWTSGRLLSWTGEYRIPARFASDWLPFSWDNLQSINGSVDLVEVFGE